MMSATIFIYAEEELLWWSSDSGHATAGKVDELAFKAKDQEVVVILPLAQTVRLPIEIKAKSVAQLQAAVPYALEEQLLSPVEDLHFALSADNRYAWVVAHQIMQACQEWLLEKNIVASHFVPESALLQTEEGQLLVSVLADTVIVSNDAGSVRVSSADALAVTQALVAEQEVQVKLLAYPESDQVLAEQLATGLHTTVTTVHQPYVPALSAQYQTNLINLLQGPYKAQSVWMSKSKPWWPSAGLLAGLALLFLVLLGYQNAQLRDEVRSLDAQINQVYTTAFPGSTVVNAKAQMEQKLAALGQSTEQNGLSLFLADASRTLLKTGDVDTKGVSYSKGKLQFEVQAASLDPLEKVTAVLKETYKAQMKSVNMNAGKAHATVEVKR